jgi:hypothetical protein
MEQGVLFSPGVDCVLANLGQARVLAQIPSPTVSYRDFDIALDAMR